MQQRLPVGAIHQFAPVDTPSAVTRFLAHWNPTLGIFIDSELWPNLITEAQARGVVLGIINARLSPRSFRRWQLLPALIRPLLACFRLCFAQTADDAERLKTLGMEHVCGIGNLKYDAPALPYREEDAVQLKQALGTRPVWLAASTHPGEEELILACHVRLKQDFPQLLTVIIPRHAVRGDALAVMIHSRGLPFAQRSRGIAITETTEIYLADTMGELGLFYSTIPIAFIGGSLVAHGGQNPLEAVQLGAAVIVGPYTGNFSAIIHDLTEADGCEQVRSTDELTEHVRTLLLSPEARAQMVAKARLHVAAQQGLVHTVTNELRPYLL